MIAITVRIIFWVWKKIKLRKELSKNRFLLLSVTKPNRGTPSERNIVVDLVKCGISSGAIFHDLYVELNNNFFSQVDIVVATKVGIIVIEIKDYSGWIFGKGYQNEWTQVLAYGKSKQKFYNPIMQNNGHIEALKKKLHDVAHVPYFSVILFSDRCVLRDVSRIPHNTYIGYFSQSHSIIKHIIENQPIAFYRDKRAVINVLKEAVSNGDNYDIVDSHIRNVEAFYQA